MPAIIASVTFSKCDRRVVKETIRLTELLLAVLIDGHEAMRSRRALPTMRSGTAPGSGTGAASGAASGSAPGAGAEQLQRQRQRTTAPQGTAASRGAVHVSAHVVPPEFQRRIIDSIRNKDTRTLLDSIENGCTSSCLPLLSLHCHRHRRCRIV